MKGLLIKDFRLMKNMKNSLIIILITAAGMSAYVTDISFVITYLSLIGATFTTSTISYDEFDNGYPFLFSLPVTRRGYAVEKYVFGLCMSGGTWLTGTIISIAAGMARNDAAPLDTFMIALMLLPVTLAMLAILIPFYLKFGGEKGRVIMVGVMGGLFLLIVLGARLVKSMHIDLDALAAGLPAMSTGAGIAAAIAIGIALLLLSCRISMGIMEKKEF